MMNKLRDAFDKGEAISPGRTFLGFGSIFLKDGDGEVLQRK